MAALDKHLQQQIRPLSKINRLPAEDMQTSDQIIKANHQKWKQWKLSLRNKSLDEYSLTLSNPAENAQNYARKLIKHLQESVKNKCPVAKINAAEMQANTCSICLEMMVEPYVPYVLFPCGHNLCQECLFLRNTKNIKVQKCPLCRAQITNYAQNKSLRKIIQDYVHQKLNPNSSKYNKSVQNDNDEQIIIKLTQNCKFLESERSSMAQNIKEFKKSKKVIEQVIDRLIDEKKKCLRNLQKVQDEARLIERHINSKQQQIEEVEINVSDLQQKQRNILGALKQLNLQRQKFLSK